MTPRGKRGKLKNPSEFSTLSTGLGNPAKGGRISTFPPRRRRVLTQPTGEKDGAATEFHLTIPVTSSTMISPASLRSDRDRHRVGISARDQIGITDHLHRNQHRQLDYRHSLAVQLRPAANNYYARHKHNTPKPNI